MREPPAFIIRKNFGFYAIKWKIKQFTLATCQENFIIRSPEFQLAPDTANWKMELETTSGDDDSVFFHLERLGGGLDVVWVNWRVAVTDNKGKSRGPVYECECHFQRNYGYTVDLESVGSLIELISDRQDILVITCHVIVKNETVDKIPNEIATDADGLISLSQDFRRMFSTGKHYDLLIKIGKTTIRAHKSILIYRNEVLSKIISASPNLRVIHLDRLNAEAAGMIIAYLYTGNLRDILNNVSLELYSCIQFFDVKELLQIFSPKNINITSRIKSQNVTFLWLFPSFATKQKRCIISKLLKKTGLDSSWRLHIYPFGRDCCPYDISILAETVTSERLQTVCIEFGLLDKWNNVITKIRIRGLAASGEVISVDNLCSRDVLLKAIEKGSLLVTFKIWYSKCDQYSSISLQQYDYSRYVYTFSHYMSLSEAMKCMMLNYTHKDITLEVRGVKVRAHKHVLAARSKTFSRMLGKFKDKIEVDMENNTFKILIKYIYFGFLGNRDDNVLAHLYEIADKFCIPSLKEDCYTRMQSHHRIITPIMEK